MIQKLSKNWKVSNTLKLPIFDRHNLGRMFGVQIAGIATAFSIVSLPSHAFDYSMSNAMAIETQTEISVVTNSLYSYPVEETLGESQSFHGFHPGVDIRAPKGTKIVAMDQGVVIEVEKIKIGYGHFVRIAHEGTMSSLYAHLDQVEVKAGDKVQKGQEIGTVGMTGWTTGPHLHFEIHQADRAVNPKGYIGSRK